MYVAESQIVNAGKLYRKHGEGNTEQKIKDECLSRMKGR